MFVVIVIIRPTSPHTCLCSLSSIVGSFSSLCREAASGHRTFPVPPPVPPGESSGTLLGSDGTPKEALAPSMRSNPPLSALEASHTSLEAHVPAAVSGLFVGSFGSRPFPSPDWMLQGGRNCVHPCLALVPGTSLCADSQ
uniref:Uncharacterized protein n=1 Tax=Molossus molossus TaxID=27622 RepID=A0A7J8J0S7_MOLMO|nr:hypothetical protein HJG59_010383 [Molossus molossus]